MTLEALAAADALRGLCGNRHQARWQVLGIEAPIPLGEMPALPEPLPMLRRFHGHRRWAKFAASTPCATALTIDGLGEGEWNQATMGFDLSMV